MRNKKKLVNLISSLKNSIYDIYKHILDMTLMMIKIIYLQGKIILKIFHHLIKI